MVRAMAQKYGIARHQNAQSCTKKAAMKRNLEERGGDLPGANVRHAQSGVTSIEYALIAALIAIAIIGAVSAAGGANGEKWAAWTGAAIAAIQSVVGP